METSCKNSGRQVCKLSDKLKNGLLSRKAVLLTKDHQDLVTTKVRFSGCRKNLLLSNTKATKLLASGQSQRSAPLNQQQVG